MLQIASSKMVSVYSGFRAISWVDREEPIKETDLNSLKAQGPSRLLSLRRLLRAGDHLLGFRDGLWQYGCGVDQRGRLYISDI